MYVRDGIAYKAKRDISRRNTLNELAAREFAKGDYDKIPDDLHTEMNIRRRPALSVSPGHQHDGQGIKAEHEGQIELGARSRAGKLPPGQYPP
jgi:hypothetical protein